MTDIRMLLIRGDVGRLAEVPAEELRSYVLGEFDRENRETVPAADRLVSLGMKLGRAHRDDAATAVVDWLAERPSAMSIDLVSLFLLGFWYRSAQPSRISERDLGTVLDTARSQSLDVASRGSFGQLLCEAVGSPLPASLHERVVWALERLEGELDSDPADAPLRDQIRRKLAAKGSR